MKTLSVIYPLRQPTAATSPKVGGTLSDALLHVVQKPSKAADEVLPIYVIMLINSNKYTYTSSVTVVTASTQWEA